VGDIDSDRMLIPVHRGKGAKDRMVPLPLSALAVLREHWKSHRKAADGVADGAHASGASLYLIDANHPQV
jgi:integrase